MNLESYAQQVIQRCDALAACTEQPGQVTRLFATPAMAQANALVAEWMRSAGMSVRQDPIGNLIGRYQADRPAAKTLLLGSHLDSVRDAGRYDGPLGVLVALAALARLHEQDRRLPFAIELLAFADEEGVRFHSTYLGSRVVAGTFDPADLERRNEAGTRMADAIRTFGGDPARLADGRRRADDLLGYCEVHIEQGPVLEALDLPVGVVTAIAGQSRCAVEFTGTAGHAGTVPIGMRQDALCAAAEFVLAVEAQARSQAGLVATVGQISVRPGASNVIPGHAALSLDVRHQDDAQHDAACQVLRDHAERIAASRRVSLGWEDVQASRATTCSPELTARLAEAIAALGYPVHRLPSGAGHDAVALAELAPVAMLFVRCKGGVSHNPAESVEAADVAVAIDVLGRFLELTGQAVVLG